MDQPDITTPAFRHEGWTGERKALFLEHLAARGNVRVACARVQMSSEAAYKLRRRDGMFARGWDAALLLARESIADIIGDRAIDGIEEDVWHRGELVGTKRRYDTRLMLAHMARLDKLAEQQASFGDAERFDEMLACIAGGPVPEAFDCEKGELPPDRPEFVAAAGREARQAVEDKWAEAAHEQDELDDEQHAALTAESDAEAARARLEAAVLWDEWQARARAAVDALRVPDSSPGTVSNVSTSPREGTPAAGPEAGPFSSAQSARRTG
jgi:hypothetical protein